MSSRPSRGIQTGQQLTLLDGGAEAFPRMVLAIEQARKTVRLGRGVRERS
jgi:hypothetical protein